MFGMAMPNLTRSSLAVGKAEHIQACAIGAGVIVGFHGGELGGLGKGNFAGLEVALDEGGERHDGAEGQGGGETALGEVGEAGL